LRPFRPPRGTHGGAVGENVLHYLGVLVAVIARLASRSF